MDAALKTIIDKRKVVTANARDEMPECAKLIDALRYVFGKPVGIKAHELESGKRLVWGRQMGEGVPALARTRM